MAAPVERPKSWTNWNAHVSGKVARTGHEFDLYSDSVIHGTARDFGPYTVMNLIAGERRETALARAVLCLRVRYAANPNPEVGDAEHGRRHPDEIAALISLILGIRLHAGGVTRYFDFGDADGVLGRPRSRAEVETPALLPGAWTEVIAHARRTARLDELSLLDSYPTLNQAAATALLRAARLYQDGLWLSERETWLTWLLLVSAVETAANAYDDPLAASSPPELLRELDPRLAAACAKYGDACVADVAKIQGKLLGATKKFLAFLRAFLPDAPPTRPEEYQVDWQWSGIEPLLKQIYRMRSSHLHAGVPFPWQLRGAPEPYKGVPTETHPDHVEEGYRRDGQRVSDPKLAIHVHVFAHIVRGAIINWWKYLSTPVAR